MSGYLVLVFFSLKPWNSTREIFWDWNIFVPRLERCPLGLYVFLFWLLATLHLPSVSPLPHPGCDFSFFPCLLGFEDPTMFLNLDLIYSTNVREKWELPFCCLRCRLSLKEEYYICKLCPTPTLFQVFPQKGYLVRLPVGELSVLACREPGAVLWREETELRLSVFCL